jgi:hypothetical protein
MLGSRKTVLLFIRPERMMLEQAVVRVMSNNKTVRGKG